jgi:uncharacterized protein DUF4177
MSQSDRWKYLVIRLKAGWSGSVPEERLQNELNSHGGLGWELVSIVPIHQGYAGLKLVFKRPA